MSVLSEAANSLRDRLSSLESISRFDAPGERQAETLVHALVDIEQSCTRLLTVLLPKLADPGTVDQHLIDALGDAGEEFRHILYHLRDAKFFAYLDV